MNDKLRVSRTYYQFSRIIEEFKNDSIKMDLLLDYLEEMLKRIYYEKDKKNFEILKNELMNKFNEHKNSSGKIKLTVEMSHCNNKNFQEFMDEYYVKAFMPYN